MSRPAQPDYIAYSMPDYMRYAAALLTGTGCGLSQPLPLRLLSEGEPQPEELRDVALRGPAFEECYIINYTGYYVICPVCFSRTNMALEEVHRFKLLAAPTEEAPVGLLVDLLPCTSCGREVRDQSVLVGSEVRGAEFLHPGRIPASPLERALRIIDFGTIRLPEWRAEIYRWKPILRPKPRTLSTGLLKSWRRNERWSKIIRDENGEFPCGDVDLPKPSAAGTRGGTKNRRRSKVEIPLDLLDSSSPDHST